MFNCWTPKSGRVSIVITSSKPLPVLKSPRENRMKQVGFAVVFFSGPQQSLGNKNNQTPQRKYPESMNQKGENKNIKNKQPNSTPLSSCFSYPPPPQKKKKNPLENFRNSGNSKNSTLQPFEPTPKPPSLLQRPPEFSIDTVGIPKIHHKNHPKASFFIGDVIPLLLNNPCVATYIQTKNHQFLHVFCYPFLKLLGV